MLKLFFGFHDKNDPLSDELAAELDNDLDAFQVDPAPEPSLLKKLASSMEIAHFELRGGEEDIIARIEDHKQQILNHEASILELQIRQSEYQQAAVIFAEAGRRLMGRGEVKPCLEARRKDSSRPKRSRKLELAAAE